MARTRKTLLKVGKIKTSNISFLPENSILDESQPYWIYPKFGVICIQKNEPDDYVYKQMKNFVRYNQSAEQQKVRDKNGVYAQIPSQIRSIAGIKANQYVSIYELGDTVAIAKATKKEIRDYLKTNKQKTPSVEGEVRRGRYLRITPELREKLDIKRGDTLLLKIYCADDLISLEVSKAPDGNSIGGIRKVFGDSYKLYKNKVAGLTFEYNAVYRDMIALPEYFLYFGNIPGGGKNVQLPFEVDEESKKITYSGLSELCETCGEMHSKYSYKVINETSCNTCEVRRSD